MEQKQSGASQGRQRVMSLDLLCLGFLQQWHVGLVLPTFALTVLWVTLFICSSSGASNSFSSNSFSRCVTICSYVPFSEWAWFIGFSGAVASWHIWIVQWRHGQQIRMGLWPVSEVRQENQLTFDLLGWRKVSGIYVLLSPLIGVLHISFDKLPEFLSDSLG